MPYVRVDILEGLTTEQKLAIHKGITDLLVKVAGKNPDYTFIAINEIADENWGHKGTSIAELKKAGLFGAKTATARKAAPTRKAAAKKAVARSAPIKRGPAVKK